MTSATASEGERLLAWGLNERVIFKRPDGNVQLNMELEAKIRKLIEGGCTADFIVPSGKVSFPVMLALKEWRTDFTDEEQVDAIRLVHALMGAVIV